MPYSEILIDKSNQSPISAIHQLTAEEYYDLMHHSHESSTSSDNDTETVHQELRTSVSEIEQNVSEVTHQLDTTVTMLTSSMNEVENRVNSRVDNIIANSSSTEGNSELIDIRMGADGKNYTTAGNAVREPVQKLLNCVDHIHNALDFEVGNKYHSFELVQGHLANGVEGASDNKVISKSDTTIEVDETTDITITNSDPSTYKMFICIYTAGGQFHDALGWRTLSSYTYSMQPGYKYRFEFSRIDNTAVTVNEITPIFQYIIGEYSEDTYHRLDNFEQNQTIIEKVQNQLAKNAVFFSIAHQGLHQIYAPQTLDAYTAAGKSKFNWAECDAAVTSDGIIICCHNNIVYADNETMRINPTLSSANSQFDVPIEIANTTYQELCRYDIAKWKSEDLPTQTFVTLEDVLKTVKYYNMNLAIDDFYKIYEAGRQEDFMTLIRKYGMENRIAVITVNLYIAQNLPKAKYFASGIASTWQSNLQSLQNIKNNYGSECWLNMQYNAITEEVKTAVRNAGIGLLAWTVNDLSQYKALLGYVDGITSDSYNYYDIIN